LFPLLLLFSAAAVTEVRNPIPSNVVLDGVEAEKTRTWLGLPLSGFGSLFLGDLSFVSSTVLGGIGGITRISNYFTTVSILTSLLVKALVDASSITGSTRVFLGSCPEPGAWTGVLDKLLSQSVTTSAFDVTHSQHPHSIFISRFIKEFADYIPTDQ